MTRAVLIGIAGGTGSGKTTLAKNVQAALGAEKVVILEQDAYYRDLSHLPPEERSRQNFDHPDAIDFRHLKDNLGILLAGESAETPVYDYATHTRRQERRAILPSGAVVLEGNTVLTDPELRTMMDLRIFVDAPMDVRFIRRLRRDLQERGRSLEDIVRQYLETVRPMHEQFVESTKKYADIIVPEGGDRRDAVDVIQRKVCSLLDGRKIS